MNKILLSTLKVAALFAASTFFAYLILKTQIKKSSERTNSFSSSKSGQVSVTETNDSNGLNEPNLVRFASSKAEAVAIVDDLDDEGSYLESSKAAPFDFDEIVIQKEPFKSPQQILEEAEEKESDKGKVLTFIPSTKSNPIVLNIPEKDLEKDRKLRTEQEEQRLLKAISNLESQLKILKSELTKLRNTKQ